MFSPSYLCLVFVGGGLGAVCRYVSTMLISGLAGTVFPLGTFTVNILGSIIMGFIMTLAIQAAGLSEELRLLLVVGFLGALRARAASGCGSPALDALDGAVLRAVAAAPASTNDISAAFLANAAAGHGVQLGIEGLR